jgi:glycosyltransferase involved in cell wall biosynthesis
MTGVSVIVPSYNYARFLDARLRSVVNQTFEDIEVIVIDDASTDNSREVIDRYLDDRRVRAIFCESNSGSVYQRWNEAASLARGRYLWFAGADDYCEDTLLEQLVLSLDAHPSSGIGFVQSWIVDESDSKLFLAPDWSETRTRDGREAMRDLVLDTTIANASAVVIRSELFRRVGGFNPRFRLAADWRFYIDVLSLSNLDYVAAPLNFCRVHPRTVSIIARRSGAETAERYRVLQDFWNRYAELIDLKEQALTREAERALINAANAVRLGAFRTAFRILTCGTNFDRRHKRRLLMALPALAATIAGKAGLDTRPSLSGLRS